VPDVQEQLMEAIEDELAGAMGPAAHGATPYDSTMQEARA
jgi:hypothetical protein